MSTIKLYNPNKHGVKLEMATVFEQLVVNIKLVRCQKNNFNAILKIFSLSNVQDEVNQSFTLILI